MIFNTSQNVLHSTNLVVELIDWWLPWSWDGFLIDLWSNPTQRVSRLALVNCSQGPDKQCISSPRVERCFVFEAIRSVIALMATALS